jgi:formylglycine-generating enzyme required for sulfatase activity
MTCSLRGVLSLALVLLPAAAGKAVAREQSIAGLPFVRIPAGQYRPLFRASPETASVPVAAFWLMARQVTNQEFLEFVRTDPGYRRDHIPSVFADQAYLSHWAGPLELGDRARPLQPIVHVSWFAARAFCESKGLRLPTEAEWERAGQASQTKADGRRDPRQRQAIMDWYAKPREQLPSVPFGRANYFGAHDMYGVAWEWVDDFNNSALSDDPREQGESARDRFCGGAALRAQDATDYAAFMRFAFRSSLQASYTGALLTFRCAVDKERPAGEN